jgi:predicted RNA-binding Zn-ribbon protein involved in translation (DUF1610 family)
MFFRMAFECPNDGSKWIVEWTCQFADHCPSCGTQVEPKDAKEIGE